LLPLADELIKIVFLARLLHDIISKLLHLESLLLEHVKMGEFLPLFIRELVKFWVDCSLHRRTADSLEEFRTPDKLLHHSIALLFADEILFMPSHVTCLDEFNEGIWILGLIRGTSPEIEQENGSYLCSQYKDN